MIEQVYLENEYLKKSLSAREIAATIGCSESKVHYWLDKHQIKKRSISEAVYVHANPKGDPFSAIQPTKAEDWFLYGLGLGLYWGEGNKANKHAVRLGNTDPALIKQFLRFLKLFKVDEKRIHFGLQIFSDCAAEDALVYWCRELNVNRRQFHDVVVVTPSRGVGTYRKKNRYGVVTVYFSNTKLRDTIVAAIDQLRMKPKKAILAQLVERRHGESP